MTGHRALEAGPAYEPSCSRTRRRVRDRISSHIIYRSTTSAFRVSSPLHTYIGLACVISLNWSAWSWSISTMDITYLGLHEVRQISSV